MFGGEWEMKDVDLCKHIGKIVYLNTAGMGYVGVLKQMGPYHLENLGPVAVLEPAQLVPHNEGVGSLYRTLLGRTKFEEEYSGRADISLDEIISVFTMPREKKE